MMSMLLVITRQLNACTDTFNDLNVTINKTITWGDHVKGLIRISHLLPLVKADYSVQQPSAPAVQS